MRFVRTAAKIDVYDKCLGTYIGTIYKRKQMKRKDYRKLWCLSDEMGFCAVKNWKITEYVGTRRGIPDRIGGFAGNGGFIEGGIGQGLSIFIFYLTMAAF